MARILIVGCGYLGEALARQLLARGDEVWGLRRRAGGLPPGVRGLVGDVGRDNGLPPLPDRLDGVVYAVAALDGSEAAYRLAYVEGPARLLRALTRSDSPPGRLLFVSSTAVYGQSQGEWVDEDAPTAPTGHAGRTLLAGEALLAAGPLPCTRLRLGGIYGPGRARLIDEVRRGQARLPSGPPRWVNRIHRDDAAAALARLLALDAPPAVLLGVDDEPGETGTVLRWLARELGCPPPPLAEAGEPQEAGRSGNRRCRNDRLLACGVSLRFPTFREGFRGLLRG